MKGSEPHDKCREAVEDKAQLIVTQDARALVGEEAEGSHLDLSQCTQVRYARTFVEYQYTIERMSVKVR